MGVFFWVIYAGYALGFYYAAKVSREIRCTLGWLRFPLNHSRVKDDSAWFFDNFRESRGRRCASGLIRLRLPFYLLLQLIASGEMDSGTTMSVIFSIFTSTFSLALITPNMQSLAYAQGAGGKVFEIIDRVPLIDSSSQEGLRPSECLGEIRVHNVSFVYPSRPDVPILSNYSLSIPKGRVTALVGGSGSGKSTLISLMERFYDPDEGFLTLDGKNLKDLNIKWLRTQIGLVSQEPTLFATTIRGNIEHGLLNTQYEHLSAELRDRLVVWAAKQANAHDFIEKLPEKYETMVGERGFLLSGVSWTAPRRKEESRDEELTTSFHACRLGSIGSEA